MDTISQWHKFKFQNRGQMMHPNIYAILIFITQSLVSVAAVVMPKFVKAATAL